MGGTTTQDRIRISVTDPKGLLAGPWRMASPQAGEREVTTGYEESGGAEVSTAGRMSRGERTIERRFRAERDQPIVDALDAHPEWFDGTVITRVFLDAAYNPIPNRRSVDDNLTLQSFTGPEADADSPEQAMLQITFKALSGPAA